MVKLNGLAEGFSQKAAIVKRRPPINNGRVESDSSYVCTDTFEY